MLDMGFPEAPRAPLRANVGRTRLSSAEIEAFGAELDALRDRVMRSLGEKDARYLESVIRSQRWAELGGRALLFAGLFPPAWIAGVSLLSLSKILENMEVGHNVLHGQYDWMNDPELSSESYEWDWSCVAAQWKHYHNYLHHTFTNIVGKDRDIGYGLLRMADDQPWNPLNLGQPLYAIGLMLLFEWGVAVHDLELNHLFTGRQPVREFVRKFIPFAKKAAPQKLKDYVLYPSLAGIAAPAVFAGNFTANMIRNVWAFLVIFCGHFPEGVWMYRPEEAENESRGQWYLRQIHGSANVEGSRLFHVLSGHLSHQIEHHLFPDMPAPRYAEIAAEVEEICRRHGVPYNSDRFGRQLGTVVKRILRSTLPPKEPKVAL